MLESVLLDQIESLRIRLETVMPMPVLIVVSSARNDDGKSLVASSLASSMKAAGYSTLLVLSDERTNSVFGPIEPRSLDEVLALGLARYGSNSTSQMSVNVMALSSENMRHSVSRATVSRFAEMCRGSYQITIIEASATLANSFAMLSALAADSILLTFQEGRRVCSEDRQLARTLLREQMSFWGMVSVAPELIRAANTGISVKNLAKPSASIPAVMGGPEPKRQPV